MRTRKEGPQCSVALLANDCFPALRTWLPSREHFLHPQLPSQRDPLPKHGSRRAGAGSMHASTMPLSCLCSAHTWVSSTHLHQLLELSLDVLQATNVLPGHLRHLHHRLAQGRGVALAQGPLGGARREERGRQGGFSAWRPARAAPTALCAKPWEGVP